MKNVKAKALKNLGLTPLSLGNKYITNTQPRKANNFMEKAFRYIGQMAMAQTKKQYQANLNEYRDFCQKYIEEHPKENVKIPAPPSA